MQKRIGADRQAAESDKRRGRRAEGELGRFAGQPGERMKRKESKGDWAIRQAAEGINEAEGKQKGDWAIRQAAGGINEAEGKQKGDWAIR